MRRSWFFLFLLGFGAIPARQAVSGPADSLLKLIASDSGLTLIVEDFRARAGEMAGSPSLARIEELPAVRGWLASPPYRKAEQAARHIEAALEVKLERIRDDILGDALALSLQPGPAGRPDQSRGLLLVKPRDRALLARLVRAIDDAQIRSGELSSVELRNRGVLGYSARLFKPIGRPPEYYAALDDGTFAWSNSEPLLWGVLDRKATDQPGLGDDPDFRKVRAGLPARPLASLFINPRIVERSMAGGAKAEGDRASAMIARYIGSVGQFGLALLWDGGISLHSSESIAPQKLDPWLREWLTGPPVPAVLKGRLSPSTVAVASLGIDFPALVEAARDLVTEAERPSLANLRQLLQGVLLGRDPLTDLVPRLKPGLLLALEVEPDQAIRPRFSVVGAIDWSDNPGSDPLAGPVANGLRTLMAFHALNPKGRADHLQVESRTVGETKVTLLTGGAGTILSGRVDRSRLILGTSPESVARAGPGPVPATLAEIHAGELANASTFAIVDLPRLVGEVRTLRGPIARELAGRSRRPVAAADRDLGDLLDFADLFRAATFRSTTASDATEIRRTIKLFAR